mmetsp:Transcript_28443/g.70068  ORF Transcript_28443/g.70068 Transcript_28443/m.70068 type:complete len:235 (-) Transcript_28443:1212-1916(-)
MTLTLMCPNDIAPGDEPWNRYGMRPVLCSYSRHTSSTASAPLPSARPSTHTVPPQPPPVILAPKSPRLGPSCLTRRTMASVPSDPSPSRPYDASDWYISSPNTDSCSSSSSWREMSVSNTERPLPPPPRMAAKARTRWCSYTGWVVAAATSYTSVSSTSVASSPWPPGKRLRNTWPAMAPPCALNLSGNPGESNTCGAISVRCSRWSFPIGGPCCSKYSWMMRMPMNAPVRTLP